MKTENTTQETASTKYPYIAPIIEVYDLELECSIAAGSATVKPHDAHQDVYEQWEVEVDDNRSINF